MDRKFPHHPGWKRILRSRFAHLELHSPEFRGHITLFCMDAVLAPKRVEYFQRPACIAGNGYSWLQQFPAGEHYTVTAQFDDRSQLVAWYIDICLRTGIGADQIPWLDDLYLDLVVSPTREIELKDADELLEARDSGVISAAEFDLAWREANRLVERITQDRFPLLALSPIHREMLLPLALYPIREE